MHFPQLLFSICFIFRNKFIHCLLIFFTKINQIIFTSKAFNLVISFICYMILAVLLWGPYQGLLFLYDPKYLESWSVF